MAERPERAASVRLDRSHRTAEFASGFRASHALVDRERQSPSTVRWQRLDQLPQLTRGRGVVIQRYKEGGLADVKVFTPDQGLAWRSGARIRTLTQDELEAWIGKRAQTGRRPPPGSPRTSRFG